MTFKECRKYDREEINKSNHNYGFIYKDKNGDFTFSFVHYTSKQPEYVLEKNGVVDKVINGHCNVIMKSVVIIKKIKRLE